MKYWIWRLASGDWQSVQGLNLENRNRRPENGEEKLETEAQLSLFAVASRQLPATSRELLAASHQLELFPIFQCPPGVRDHNGATNQIGDRKNFEKLFGSHTKFMAFFEVVLDTIVAPQNHRADQPEHLLGF